MKTVKFELSDALEALLQLELYTGQLLVKLQLEEPFRSRVVNEHLFFRAQRVILKKMYKIPPFDGE